jgi:hypothetical protein
MRAEAAAAAGAHVSLLIGTSSSFLICRAGFADAASDTFVHMPPAAGHACHCHSLFGTNQPNKGWSNRFQTWAPTKVLTCPGVV